MIGKLQFQRIIPMGQVACFVLILWAFFQNLSLMKEKGFPFALRNAFYLVVFVPTVISQFRGSKYDMLTFLLFFAGCFWLLVFLFWVNRTGRPYLAALPALGAAAVVITVFAIDWGQYRIPDNIRIYLKRYSVRLTGLNTVEEIPKWLRQNTGKEEIILVPPVYDEFLNTLQLESLRAAYFVHKNVPYTDHGVYEWSRRAEDLLGHPPRGYMRENHREASWKARSTSEIEEIARRNGIRYIVDRGDFHSSYTGRIIISGEYYGTTWNLWELVDAAPEKSRSAYLR